MSDYPIRHIDKNPSLEGQARMVPNITFTDREENPLTMQLFRPWNATEVGDLDAAYAERVWPTVVFVQGSGWTFPDVYFELPQIAQLARRGYVVVTVTHRNYEEGHRAPAFLKDVKTAIRYLRSHAAQYSIDPEKIGIWGTSSGGNAAMLVGLTGDDPKYKTNEWADQSDAVDFVVECFGPADTGDLLQDIEAQAGQADEVEKNLLLNFIGSPDGGIDMDLVRELSPIERIEEGRTYPPFLLLHGDGDPVVAYEPTVRFYNKLRDHGTEAEMVCVDGAQHEGNFWSEELFGIIWDFIDRHSK